MLIHNKEESTDVCDFILLESTRKADFINDAELDTESGVICIL